MAHDERADGHVEGLLGRGGVGGGEGIERKLIVGRGGGVGAIEPEMGREHLCRRDAHTPVEQLPGVDAHCQARCPNHRGAALVVDGGVVDDDAVEEPEVDATYFHARVEGGGEQRRHSRGCGTLDIGYMQQYGNQQIKADHRP